MQIKSLPMAQKFVAKALHILDQEIFYSIPKPRGFSNYPRCAGLSVGMIKGFRAPEKTSVTATDNDRDRPTDQPLRALTRHMTATPVQAEKESIALLLLSLGNGNRGIPPSVTLPVVARARRGHSQAARGEARSAANGWSMTEGKKDCGRVRHGRKKESVQERLELDMDLNV